MKRFLILSGILVIVLLVADAWSARAGNTFTVEFGHELSEGGGRTSRRHFYDHDYRPPPERFDRTWREANRPGVERVADGYRFSYRDRDYQRVWLLADASDWAPVALEYDADREAWSAVVELDPGVVSYQFRVERDDGTIRDRTDPTNPTRRRDLDQGWVSRIEIGRDGDVKVQDRDRDRRDRREHFDLALFNGFGADYQRADGFFLRASPKFSSRDPWSPAVHTTIGYGFSSERGGGRLYFLQPLMPGGRVRAVIGGYDFSDYTDRTAVGDLENSLATLAFREDSRDWYRRKGLSFGLELEEIQNLLLRVEFRSDEHATMPKKVVAGWGGRGDFLPNPEIDDGLMRSLLLRARWGDDLTHLWVEYENGLDDLFSSSFDYESLIVQGRLKVQVGWAQTLHLRARWGTELRGDLPVQKQFVAGGLGTVRGFVYQSLYTPSSDPTPYGGDELALFNAEYVLGVHDDISLGLFFDTGMVWEEAGSFDFSELKNSAGVGLILAEPGDSSLRLDFIQTLESGGRFLVQGRLTRPF